MTDSKVQKSILQRIAAGDKSAVERCIDTYGGLVWSLARKLSPNEAEAEDAVQEIFIELWKNAARFDAVQSNEVTFVAMIARRRLIDRLRQSKRRLETVPIADDVNKFEPQYSEQLDVRSDAAVAFRAMQQLRPEQQKVLQLAIYQGLSHQEISAATSLPLGTVKTYVRRGLNQIRTALGVRLLDAAKEVSS
ncbi:MAG: sigma-70 family RNA polymerase sigma factor [Acidobacteria bacterium]|nr:sigma-70 family RNA polymerase sigma factor [Acidobacteriota bacterium]